LSVLDRKKVLPAREFFGDVFPFISLFSMKLEEFVLLIESPRVFRDDRREMIVPSLSALFS